MAVLLAIRDFIEEKLPPVVGNSLVGAVNFVNNLRQGQINRLTSMLEAKPLILAVETISVCNARCVFCAYPTMNRKHEVMPVNVFTKVISEYSRAGGGALSLTPVMGDPLVDPHFLERFDVIKKFSNINQISFTTNGIAFSRFNDEELERILRETFLIQFSIGGLDAKTYNTLYKVDKFEEVMASVQRVLAMKEKKNLATQIILAFRTNNPSFESEYAEQLSEFRRRGVFISHIYLYNNYAGEVNSSEIKIKRHRVVAKNLTCALPLLHGHVFADGKITNCGCVDANGNGLVIGDTKDNTLSDIWQGEKRRKILQSFPSGKPPKLCQDCNAYRPLTYLGSNVFRNTKSGEKIPLEFYIKFFGG